MRSVIVVAALGWVGLGSPALGQGNFTGTWETTFGVMTLKQDGAQVQGFYLMDGERCTLEGKAANQRLTFTYQEPGADGTGWFEIAADGKSFSGKWRER